MTVSLNTIKIVDRSEDDLIARLNRFWNELAILDVPPQAIIGINITTKGNNGFIAFITHPMKFTTTSGKPELIDESVQIALERSADDPDELW